MYLCTGSVKELSKKKRTWCFHGNLAGLIVMDVEHLHVYTCVDAGHERNHFVIVLKV